eukprot:GGOE01037455.1.p1 GENE.GGOE01037455.1~~GGOE01037455.1.p1  ORF type:complete len:362 (+),score=98.65 GGOE01037455.1:60-1145(+)
MKDPRAGDKWIFSAELDAVAFAVPIVVSYIAAPALWYGVEADGVPLAAHILLVVLLDVGHVWTTLFRTYLDSEERRRRPLLYGASPAVLFLLSFALHLWSPRSFWTVLGYTAIFHFTRQFYGWLALCKGRNAEHWDWTLDKCAIYAGSVFPCALWHADDTRWFDWFQRDDPFPVPLPPALRPYLLATYVTFLLGYTARQVQLGLQGRFNHRKALLVLACHVTWAVGILVPHRVISLCFLNLIHAIPSYMVIFFCCKNKWATHQPQAWTDRFVRWMCTPAHVPAYLALFFVLGACEELLWDALVWHDYLPVAALPELGDVGLSFATAALALPQALHYWLDTYIWKMGPHQNPGLRSHLGLAK